MKSHLKSLAIALAMVILAFLISLMIPPQWAHGDAPPRQPYLSHELGWMVLDEHHACPAAERSLVPALVRDGDWRMGTEHHYRTGHTRYFCWDLGFEDGELMVMVKYFHETEVNGIPLSMFKMQEKAPVSGKAT